MTIPSIGNTVTHHPRFYHPNGSIIFWVEDTLYKLFHDALEQDCQLFHDLFWMPCKEQTQGKVDENPIFLPCLTVEVFDLYLELSGGW